MVKMILMYTAQPLAGFNQLEQGAGEINIEGAVRLAKLIRTDLPASPAVGTPLLADGSPVPQTTINYVTSTGRPASTSFTWSQGVIAGRTYAACRELVTTYQGIYGLGVVYSDGVIYSDGVLLADWFARGEYAAQQHMVLTRGE